MDKSFEIHNFVFKGVYHKALENASNGDMMNTLLSGLYCGWLKDFSGLEGVRELQQGTSLFTRVPDHILEIFQTDGINK